MAKKTKKKVKKQLSEQALENKKHDELLGKVRRHLGNVEEQIESINDYDFEQYDIKSLEALEIALNNIFNQTDMIYMSLENADQNPCYKFDEADIKALKKGKA